MRSIIGLTPEALGVIRTAWQWIEDQISVTELAADLRTPFKVCFQTTVCELISRHYVDNLNQDEYLDSYTQCLVEDVIKAVFEYDENDILVKDISGIIDIVVYEPNTFWALVITHYMKHRCAGIFITSNETETVTREHCDDREGLIAAIVYAMSLVIESAIEEHEIVSHLPKAPGHLVVDNVEVSLSSNSIIIWS